MSLLVLRFIDSRDAKQPWCLSAVFSFVFFRLVLRAVGQSGESLSLMETLLNILGLKFAAMSFSKELLCCISAFFEPIRAQYFLFLSQTLTL